MFLFMRKVLLSKIKRPQRNFVGESFAQGSRCFWPVETLVLLPLCSDPLRHGANADYLCWMASSEKEIGTCDGFEVESAVLEKQ